MNNFIYDNSVKVYFGENQLDNLGPELSKYGKRVLMTYGGGSIKKIGLYDAVKAELKKAGLKVFELSGIEPNPRIESVRKGVQICKDKKIDVLLAVGGGSTIDATKFIAAGACVDHDPWDFFSEEWAPIEKALPIVTVLTMAAAGSEMDCGGVVTNLKTKEKVGRVAKPLLPKVSFLDPTVTYTVPPYQTACGAADIMSHIMEIYFNMNLDLYMLDRCMEAMMKTVIKFAPLAMRDPDNYEARANLMWTSTWAINGFIVGGKSQEWSCHPMEHELSGIYDITHGLGLAILTPRWMEYCLDKTNVYRYYQFAVNVFGVEPGLNPMETAKKGIEKLSEFFFKTLGLPSTLSELGVKKKDIPIMAEKACAGSVIEGFKTLNKKDIEKIFNMCM